MKVRSPLDQVRTVQIANSFDFLAVPIAMRKDAMYLGSDLDGFARLNRPHCRQWERYRLIRTDTIEAIMLMRRFSWRRYRLAIGSFRGPTVLLRTRQPRRRAPWRRRSRREQSNTRRELAFGPARIPLVGTRRVITFEQSDHGQEEPPIHMVVADGQGRSHRFSRVRVGR